MDSLIFIVLLCVSLVRRYLLARCLKILLYIGIGSSDCNDGFDEVDEHSNEWNNIWN